MMRIGIDGRKIPEAAKRGPIASLQHARDLGMAGLFFRTVLDMSPTLDPGLLGAIREKADELGMYLETGLGKVNPYATPEAPELRMIGDGDIVKGYRRMMEACAAIGCREVWVATCNHKSVYKGRWCYDRFRTDVSWSDQLAATKKFLDKLAPIARDLGMHMNIETHEEITSFEVVRLVEAVGPDVTGIVFDTANVLQRVEHPVYAARRVAPYVRQTHIKDALLAFRPDGVDFQMRPCGQGVIDFREILPLLVVAKPDLHLSIENATSHDDTPPSGFRHWIELFDRDFIAAHPDLSVEELAAYVELVQTYGQRIAAGEVPDWAGWAAQPFGYGPAVAYVAETARYLREVCSNLNLPLEPAPVASATA